MHRHRLPLLITVIKVRNLLTSLVKHNVHQRETVKSNMISFDYI